MSCSAFDTYSLSSSEVRTARTSPGRLWSGASPSSGESASYRGLRFSPRVNSSGHPARGFSYHLLRRFAVARGAQGWNSPAVADASGIAVSKTNQPTTATVESAKKVALYPALITRKPAAALLSDPGSGLTPPPVTSALGHKRTLDRECGVSAYLLKADMLGVGIDVCKVPEAEARCPFQ